MKKISIIAHSLLASALMFSLQGCISSAVSSGAEVAYDHRHFQNTLHDHYVTLKIDRAIHWKTNHFQTSHVSITTFNNITLLTGQIPTQALHDEIEKIAKSVADVQDVYNLTTIENPTSNLIRLSDAWITTKVSAQLIAQNEIDPSQIKVITEDGTVYLMGTVFKEQANIATSIARHTAGVQHIMRVFSYLELSKMPPQEMKV